MDFIFEPKKVKHLHNSDMATFLSDNKENPHIKKYLEEMQAAVVEELNEEYGTEYKSYIGYLNENAGDDSPLTMKELIALREGK